MGILGKPAGIFDLHNSNKYVGSYIKKTDVKEILQLTEKQLEKINFIKLDNLEVVDEI